jgi:small multidrug resistance family-3 protein
MTAALLFPLAALAEIGGCFVVWAVLRQGAHPAWLAPGLAALSAFAWLLALAPVDAAGRAFAAYGGVYIAAALLWAVLVEGARLSAWDLCGAALCLMGTGVILLGAER